MENNENKYTFRIVDEFTVSSDEDERKDKAGTKVNVTFVFADWTAEELVNRLLISNSPRVAVQAILRKMKVIPSTYEYVVPKPGTRAGVNFEAKLIALIGKEKAAVIIDKYGSTEAAIKALAELI